MKECHGGDSAPADWDGGPVLMESVSGWRTFALPDRAGDERWLDFAGDYKVVAYTPKTPPAASSGQDLREALADSSADEWAGAHYDNLSPSQQQQWHVFRAGYLCAASEVNAMESALLADADQMLAEFREGDPGKNIQTLVPTPEWKEITKAANRRGVSLSLFLRIAARQHLVWLKNYRSPDALLSAPAVQPGGDLVVVPREPTEAMCIAAWDGTWIGEEPIPDLDAGMLADIWRAMVAAATPQPEAEEGA
jgi:hypothetical protein